MESCSIAASSDLEQQEISISRVKRRSPGNRVLHCAINDQCSHHLKTTYTALPLITASTAFLTSKLYEVPLTRERRLNKHLPARKLTCHMTTGEDARPRSFILH